MADRILVGVAIRWRARYNPNFSIVALPDFVLSLTGDAEAAGAKQDFELSLIVHWSTHPQPAPEAGKQVPPSAPAIRFWIPTGPRHRHGVLLLDGGNEFLVHLVVLVEAFLRFSEKFVQWVNETAC